MSGVFIYPVFLYADSTVLYYHTTSYWLADMHEMEEWTRQTDNMWMEKGGRRLCLLIVEGVSEWL